MFLVSSQYVYKFDCYPVIIHRINKEASTQALQKKSGLTRVEAMVNFRQ